MSGKKNCKCVSRNKLPIIYRHKLTKLAFNRIRPGVTDAGVTEITEEEKKNGEKLV